MKSRERKGLMERKRKSGGKRKGREGRRGSGGEGRTGKGKKEEGVEEREVTRSELDNDFCKCKWKISVRRRIGALRDLWCDASSVT